jgi:hypothetical protein
MVKDNFVRVFKGIDRWIFTTTFTAPGTDHPRKWIEIWVQTFRNSKDH